jgi:hypothetical protein
MSTLCRARRECQGNVRQGNKTERVRCFHSPDNHSADRIPSAPLENNPKYRVKGGRKISDNRKYFGLFFGGSATVLSLRSSAEADSVAVWGVSRRTSGQRCVWRDAKHRARVARAPSSNQSCGSNWVKPMPLGKLTGKSYASTLK